MLTRGVDVDAGDRHIDGRLDRGCLRTGEVSLRLLEGHLIVAWVDLSNRVADLYRLIVFDINLDDLAGDSGAYLIEIAVHLSVVSVLAEG